MCGKPHFFREVERFRIEEIDRNAADAAAQ